MRVPNLSLAVIPPASMSPGRLSEHLLSSSGPHVGDVRPYRPLRNRSTAATSARLMPGSSAE